MNRLTQYTHLALLALLALVAGGCGVEGRSALGAQEAMGGGDPEVVARRVLDLAAEQGTDVLVSPDGRHVAYTLWEDDIGTLMLRELHGGPTDGQVIREGVAQHHPWVTRFSRDAKRLAFMQAVPEGGYELRTIDTDGSREQLLVAMDRPELPVEWAEAYDWSPDGTKLLVSFWMADKTTHLALLSPDNGSSTILKTFDWRAPSAAAFSPDGQFVAYDFQADEDKRARDIYVLGTDGSREIRLTDDPGVKRLTGWSRDGSAVYYSAEGATARSLNIWRLPVRDGRLAGAAGLIRGDVVDVSSAVLGDDRIFYSVDSRFPSVWTITVDLESGRLVTPASPFVSEPSSARVRFGPEQMKWTRDGQYLTYFRSSTGSRPGLELVLRSATTPDERTIALDLDQVPWQMPWSHDEFIVRGRSRGRDRLLLLNLTSGQLTPFEDPDLAGSGPMVVQFSPDRKVKYVQRQREGRFELVALDLESGSERVLHESPQGNFFGFNVSPGGEHIAFVVRQSEQGDELRVLPTSGGGSWVAHHAPPGRIVGGGSTNWTSDGRMIVFHENDPGGGGIRFWKVNRDGGGAQMIYEGPPVPSAVPNLHPDDRRIVFRTSFQEVPPIQELWVLENLPETRGAAPSGGRD